MKQRIAQMNLQDDILSCIQEILLIRILCFYFTYIFVMLIDAFCKNIIRVSSHFCSINTSKIPCLSQFCFTCTNLDDIIIKKSTSLIYNQGISSQKTAFRLTLLMPERNALSQALKKHIMVIPKKTLQVPFQKT